MDSSHIPSTSPPLATENSLAYPDTGYSCISVANDAPVKKGRKQPERYLFSKEITVHHRKEKAYKGKFIVKAFFRDFPTKAQLRKNPSRFGNRISKFFSSSSLASDDEIVPYLESLVWSDKHLRPIICEALKKKFGKDSVSIKTAWYMHIDKINALKGYKHDVCTAFFSLVTDKDAFFYLQPGISSKSEAETALKEFCKKYGYKKTKERELLYQLRIIWDAVCKEENPFREMLAVRDVKHDRYSDMRQSTTLKSLSNERLATLNDFLQNKNDLSFSALIAIKNRLGLSAGVIGALTWGDYVTVPYVGIHALQISKQFGESGTEPELLSDPDKNRLISLDSKTDKIFRSYYTQEQANAACENISNATLLTLPIFHNAKDRHKALSRNKVNDLIAVAKNALQIPEKIISLPEGSYKQKVDINKYRGDLFRSDFDYTMRNAKIDPDDIAYLKGTKMEQTVNVNYRDHLDSCTQLILFQEMNRAQYLDSPEELDTSTHLLCIKDNVKKSIPPQPARISTRFEFEITEDINLEEFILSIGCRFGADVTIRFESEIDHKKRR